LFSNKLKQNVGHVSTIRDNPPLIHSFFEKHIPTTRQLDYTLGFLNFGFHMCCITPAEVNFLKYINLANG